MSSVATINRKTYSPKVHYKEYIRAEDTPAEQPAEVNPVEPPQKEAA